MSISHIFTVWSNIELDSVLFFYGRVKLTAWAMGHNAEISLFVTSTFVGLDGRIPKMQNLGGRGASPLEKIWGQNLNFDPNYLRPKAFRGIILVSIDAGSIRELKLKWSIHVLYGYIIWQHHHFTIHNDVIEEYQHTSGPLGTSSSSSSSSNF